MGLADFFLYGGSSGGGGGGSSLPSNWDVESNSLTIKGEGLNSLGWRCSNKDYYFEKNFEWDVTYDVSDLPQTDTYEKVKNVPGFVYRCHSEVMPQVYWYEGLSTSADGALLECGSQEVTTSSFTYNNTTWYLCKSYSYDNLDSDKINTAGYSLKLTDAPEAIAKYIIDASEVSFTASNDFTQLASPDKDYTIAAGGSASDFSDATFRVNSSGDVYGGNFYSNGVAISSAFTGATSSSAGAPGIVPAPSSADVNKFLKGNGSWAEAGTPGNWNINPTSLVMQDTGKEVNSLGWYCGNKENYYEEAKTWSVYQVGGQGRDFTKSNDKPAFIAAFRPIDSIWVHSICVSTEADATHFSYNSQHYEFEYLGETWYYSGGDYSLSEGDYTIVVSGINRLPDDTFASLSDAAKFLIDQGLVSFNSGKKTILSDPSQEHIILGGGIQDDGSDATFKVSNAGVIEASGMVVNGVAVTSAFTGATSSAAGSVGLVPAPGISDRNKILKGDGTWMTQKPSPISYSTSEQDTGIKWIDGNKIYQTTYDLGGEVEITSSGVSIGSYISNIDDILVFITATALTTGSAKQCSSIWFGYAGGTLKAYCNEGMMASHITLTYTKRPSLDDSVLTTSNYSAANDTASQHGYVYKNWRSPNVFSPAYRTFNLTADFDSSAVYAWSTYETADRVDGCDWVRYDHSESYVPYCVAIGAHSSNAWGGTYPTVYIEFSNDGTTWDTLYTGIPVIAAGTYCYIPINTDNSYSKIRVRYNNGTGMMGTEWMGALPHIDIFAS